MNQEPIDVPIQSLYSESARRCYGCGTAAKAGHQLQSFWDGEQARAEHTVDANYMGVEGFVYGGMLASLIDCHATATAAAASGFIETEPTRVLPRYVTGTLEVKFVAPTPLGSEPLVLEAEVVQEKGRKSNVEVELRADGKVCVVGKVVAIQIPDTMKSSG